MPNSDNVLFASGGPTGFEGWTYGVSINGLQMPHAPPNSAVYPDTAPACGHTTLSPLFTGFSTGDSLPTTSLHRPPSIRGWSFGTDQRRRSSTLVNPGSATADLPVTPHTAYSNTYPYPSPRSSASSHSYHPSSAIRHPSAPSLGHPGRNSGVKRVVHPSPAWTTVLDLSSQVTGGYSATELVGSPAEPKQTRFKPTKEQLDILISAYEENINPDPPTREMLAKRLGVPNVKTIGIWFQNRRSKSRAREREANLPRPLHVEGHRSPDRVGTGGKKAVDMRALRQLTHDDDPNLTLLPLTVLAISSWTRFLTPGIGLSAPDLGASLSVMPDPRLHIFVMHQSETFRVTVPVSSSTISDVRITWGNASSGDSVAVAFDVISRAAEFFVWSEEDGTSGWRRTSDFTAGAAVREGRWELTGQKAILLPAFARIQNLITAIPDLSPSTADSLFSWRFPLDPTCQGAPLDNPTRSHSASISTSTTTDTESLMESLTGPTTSMTTLLKLDTSFQTHIRQRSSSAPIRCDTDISGFDFQQWPEVTLPDASCLAGLRQNITENNDDIWDGLINSYEPGSIAEY